MYLRELRYLVTVGEAGHVGRAAGRPFIRRPSLSNALRKLEREPGAVLLRRHSHGVDLVAAGCHVGTEARRTLHTAGEQANGSAGRLRTGYHAAGAVPSVVRILATFEAGHPGTLVESCRWDGGRESAALREGEAVLALIRQPGDLAGLASMPLTGAEPLRIDLAWHP